MTRIKDLFGVDQGFIALMPNLPWDGVIDNNLLDFEFLLNHGEGTASPLVERLVKDGSLSLEDKKRLALYISTKYNNTWTRYFEVAKAQYVAYENYNMKESGHDVTTNHNHNVVANTGDNTTTDTTDSHDVNVHTGSDTVTRTPNIKEENTRGTTVTTTNDLHDQDTSTSSGQDSVTLKHGEHIHTENSMTYNSSNTNSGSDSENHSGTDSVDYNGSSTVSKSGTEKTATNVYAYGTQMKDGKPAQFVTVIPDTKDKTEFEGRRDSTTHGEKVETVHGLKVSHGGNDDTVTDEKHDGDDTTTTKYGRVDSVESSHSGTVTDATTGTDTVKTTGTDENKTTYNSTVDNKTNAKNTSKVVFNSGVDTKDDGTNDLTHNLTRRGNIGVTTTQQMLQSEIDLWRGFNLIDSVFADIYNEIALPIYEEVDQWV